MQATIAFRSIRGFQTNTVCTKPRDVLKVTISFRKQGTRNSSSPSLPTRFTSRLMTGLYTRGVERLTRECQFVGWTSCIMKHEPVEVKIQCKLNWFQIPFIFDLFKRNRFIVVNKLARYIDDHKLYCDHALQNL